MAPAHHPEITHLAGTPAGGTSAYPSELMLQNLPWRAAPRPYPVGFPATANPDLAYVAYNEPRFAVPSLSGICTADFNSIAI